MKLLKLTRALALVVITAAAAQAQALIKSVSPTGQDLIVGAYAAYDCVMSGYGLQWTSPSNPQIPAHGSWTAGISSGGTAISYDPYFFWAGYRLKNASARGTVGPNTYLVVEFQVTTTTPGSFRYSLLGSTLNQFGLTGAGRLRYYVQTYDGSSWSGFSINEAEEVHGATISGTPQRVRIGVHSEVSEGTALVQLDSTSF